MTAEAYRAVPARRRAAAGAPAFRLAVRYESRRPHPPDDRAARRRRPHDRAPRRRDRVRGGRHSRRGRRGRDREGAARHRLGDRARRSCEPSPDRVDGAPDGACGGSVLAHISYERQRELKSDDHRRCVPPPRPHHARGADRGRRLAGRRLSDARAAARARWPDRVLPRRHALAVRRRGQRGSCAPTPSTCSRRSSARWPRSIARRCPRSSSPRTSTRPSGRCTSSCVPTPIRRGSATLTRVDGCHRRHRARRSISRARWSCGDRRCVTDRVGGARAHAARAVVLPGQPLPADAVGRSRARR